MHLNGQSHLNPHHRLTPMPLTKLASLVGFSDYNYFSRIFKKHMKESPAHYFNKWNTSK